MVCGSTLPTTSPDTSSFDRHPLEVSVCQTASAASLHSPDHPSVHGDDAYERSELVSQLQCGVSTDPGGRTNNDDRHILFSTSVPGRAKCTMIAVLDGHHAHYVASVVRDELPRLFVAAQRAQRDVLAALGATVAALDEHVYSLFERGCLRTGGTTLLALVVSGEQLYVANVGDCKALLSVRGVGEVLNTCHNPDVPSERRRFAAAGVLTAADFIPCSDINVCRSIGDWDLGRPLKWMDVASETSRGPLVGDPELRVRELSPLDEFFVVASDGLWDYYTPDSSVVSDARRALRANKGDAQSCSEWLASQALLRQRATLHSGTPGDNITVAVVTLRPLPQLPRHSRSRLNLRAVDGT